MLLLSSSTPNLAYAEGEGNFYAKVQNTGVNFCSSPSENSAIFELPYSYFVKVTQVVDDYYKVAYKEVEGYVKKDKVKLMNGKPKQPYAEASFKIFVPYALYQSPTQDSTVNIPLSSSSTLNYFGSRKGQQVMSNNNTWFYASIMQEGKQTFGYIFSGVTDYMTEISINNETFEVVSDDSLSSSTTEFSKLSTGTKVMLIVSIGIPSLLILYFLIKPSKILQTSKQRQKLKKENRKIRHGDYFEFDESEL